MDYTGQKIVQLQRQYDMLVKSLIFSSFEEKENIYYELNKIENSILDETGKIYNDEYYKLINTKTSLLKEEKDRLINLIDLIESRRKYVNEEVNKHRSNINFEFDVPEILGLDNISKFQKKIKIIDKYRQNVRLKDKLVKEIDVIKEKLNKSESKIRSNDRINKELETKMIDMLEKSFKAMEIYSYKEREEEIELAFNELSFAKEKAIQNIESAKNANNSTLLVECEKMYDSVEEEYRKYFEKKMLLRLLNMYDRITNNYEELFAKREEINDLLTQIDSSDFYKLVFGEINKQYNTIKLEQQDIKTYNALNEDKAAKERLLNEIEEENNSEEFAKVLDELLKNEKIKHEREEQERRKIEYEERQKRLIEESKRQEEIRKKQKIIEEERKRDIEIRTRELLEKQKTGIIPKIDAKSNDKQKDVVREKFVDNVLSQISNDDKKKVDASVEEFFPVKEEVKELNNKVLEESKKVNAYDSILEDNNIKDEKSEFSIPVIKNDKLVAKKVKEEKANENDVDEFMKKFLEDSKKEEVMEVNDMVFPDMPM